MVTGHRLRDTEFPGLRARFVLWYDTISEVRNHPAPPHPVPAPHPPGFQPGVAHGTQLNASVARGDTKIMTNMNHNMSFDSLDEVLFNLLAVRGTRKYPRILQLIIYFILFAVQVPKRAKFARTSKVFEVPAVRGTRKYPRILRVGSIRRSEDLGSVRGFSGVRGYRNFEA